MVGVDSSSRVLASASASPPAGEPDRPMTAKVAMPASVPDQTGDEAGAEKAALRPRRR